METTLSEEGERLTEGKNGGEDKAVVVESGVTPVKEKRSEETNNQGTDPGTEVIDDERWYAANDGSYFQEHREPFFYFNFGCYVFCFGLFIYFSYSIIKDFIGQQSNPPTSTKIQNEVQQAFPGIIICNRDKNVSLDVVFAGFENSSDETVDITGEVAQICTNGTGVCVGLWGPYPAFDFIESGSSQVLTSRNAIDLVVNVNADNYSNSTLFIGVDGFLHETGNAGAIQDSLCNGPVLPPLEDCPSDASQLALDQFQGSGGVGTFVSLHRKEVQYAVGCNENLVQWDRTASIMSFNEGAFGVSLSDGVVVLQFQFDSPQVPKTSYNPISGQSMFGSLSGWFGFLTDGWGVLSLLFFTERTALFMRDRFRG